MKHFLLTAAMAVCALTASAQQNDWENQYVLSINREPARASFIPYAEKPGDMQMSLDGMWKFNWTKTPDEQPADFYKKDFNDASWTTFPVPGDWEVNGYGTPIYSSSGYTFKIDRLLPPHVHGARRMERQGSLHPLRFRCQCVLRLRQRPQGGLLRRQHGACRVPPYALP